MKTLILSCLIMLATASQHVSAAIISNGSFDDCSFNGWMKDTDGAGDISASDDFSIADNGNCAARLQVDGSMTEAFFANTLYQAITLTQGQSYVLRFDLMVGSELTSNTDGFIADYFAVAFGDGSGNFLNADGTAGTLIQADIDGEASYSVEVALSDMLTSLQNLTLEFQLLVGADEFGSIDFGSSFMQIDNVSVTAVSEPFSLSLVALSFLGLVGASRHRQSRRAL